MGWVWAGQDTVAAASSLLPIPALRHAGGVLSARRGEGQDEGRPLAPVSRDGVTRLATAAVRGQAVEVSGSDG